MNFFRPIRLLGWPCVLVAVGACSDPNPPKPNTGCPGLICDDASTSPVAPPPAIPQLNGDANRTLPYKLITIRGQSNGARIVIQPAGDGVNPSTTTPDGSGEFCADVPLALDPAPGAYSFNIFALGLDGQRSVGDAKVNVQFDPAAAKIDGAKTCLGFDPATCGTQEICDNSVDDDCDGHADAADIACTPACVNDAREPNDAIPPPTMTDPGTYNNLVICPSDYDFYRIRMDAGLKLVADIAFKNNKGNLDMQLRGPAPDYAGVAKASSTGDNEHIEFVAPAGGDYFLWVYGVGGASNSYTLTIQRQAVNP